MIRENAAKIFPLTYFALLMISVLLVYCENDIGFTGLTVLSLPWSALILIFAGWTMAHDGSVFGAGIVLFIACAMFNTALIYKIAYINQYNATIGKD